MAMMTSIWFRHLREAFFGFRRNLWLSMSAVSVVGVALFIFGLSMAISWSVYQMSKEIEVGVKVVLKTNDHSAQRQLLQQVEARPDVKSAVLIPKEDAFTKVQSAYGDRLTGALFKSADKLLERFPDFIEVFPKEATVRGINSLEKYLKELNSPLISDVKPVGGACVSELVTLSRSISIGLLLYAIALAALSAFLISNAIKLNITARHEEIEIQRLVGASNWFIRWPFLIEGTFVGFVGSIVPVPMLVFTFYIFKNFIAKYQMFSIGLKLSTLNLLVAGSVIFMGIVIGALGSIISVHRFLRK
ncbi:MAG: hypothetical protein RLZ12_236 [Bacillota bacterium]|jgi:cell division transport system permease protein